MWNDAKSQRAESGWEVSGLGKAFSKSRSEEAEKEDRSWRRMLGEGGFVKMEDIGCIYMLKKTVGYTRRGSTDRIWGSAEGNKGGAHT